MADFFDRLLARSAPRLRAVDAENSGGVAARPRLPHPYERPGIFGGPALDEALPGSGGEERGSGMEPGRDPAVREGAVPGHPGGPAEPVAARRWTAGELGDGVGIRTFIPGHVHIPLEDPYPRWNSPAPSTPAPESSPRRATRFPLTVPADNRPSRWQPADGARLAASPAPRPAEALPGPVQARPPERAAVPAGLPPQAKPQEPVVNVRIGRLEVRAAAQETRGAAAKPERQGREPAVSLDEYLAREGGRR